MCKMIKTVCEICVQSSLLANIDKCFTFGMSTLHMGRTWAGKASGKSIKNLNRENKELFGPLLGKKKPSNKVKNKTVSIENMNRPLDGIEFEKNYQKSIKSNVTDSEEVPTHSLLPPDIIIRNMTLFPLLNEQKAADDWGSEVMRLPRERSEDISLPSVTRILNATMSENSRAALARWKEKLVAELGEEGFEEYSQRLLLDGRAFHSLLESHLTTPTSALDVAPAVTGCWESLRPIISEVTRVRAVESHVVHKQLKYHGVIDCIAEFRGQPAVIEWKKSDKQKPYLQSTYDAPLQAAAYLGAANFDTNYRFPLRSSVVVVAYTDGAPAHAFKMAPAECVRYWGLWLQRLQQYYSQEPIANTL